MCLSGSLAARHSLFSDPAPPRLTQPLSSRLFLVGDDDEGDCGGGGEGGDVDCGGGDEGDGDEGGDGDGGGGDEGGDGGGGDGGGDGGGGVDYEKNSKWFLLKQGPAVENFE